MKKLILAVAVTGMTLGAVNAFAVSPYVSFGGGAAWLDDADVTDTGLLNPTISFENGWAVRGAAGVALNKSVRVEVEGFYTTSDFDSASVTDNTITEIGFSSLSAMGMLCNGYYDINFGSPFIPYVGGGLGFANVEVESRARTSDETVFAYAFTAGASYVISNTFALDLGYRFLGTEDIDFDRLSVSYVNHQVLLGARFSF